VRDKGNNAHDKEKTMAKAHTFVLVPDAIPADQKVRGQAKQVLTELERDMTPRLATDIDREIADRDPFKTRQDTLRVTLYYLIVFSNRGWVKKVRPVAEPAAVEVAADDVEGTDDDQGAGEAAHEDRMVEYDEEIVAAE
jgi:hypothetical protein